MYIPSKKSLWLHRNISHNALMSHRIKTYQSQQSNKIQQDK